AGNVVSLFLHERVAEKCDVGGFATIVELRQQHIFELPKQFPCVVLLEDRKMGRPCIDQACQNLEIDLNEVVNARLANFEHHLATVEQPRGVHLRDRSTPYGRERKRCKEPIGSSAQIVFNDLSDTVCRQRSHVVLQFGKFLTIDVGEQIAARRERLSELDE